MIPLSVLSLLAGSLTELETLDAPTAPRSNREYHPPTPRPRDAPRPPSPEELAQAAVIQRIRQERIQRKLLNARRRLPKGHPDRI
jgi:hypothetical protein